MERYLMDGEETQRLKFRKIQAADYYPWLEFFKDPQAFAHWSVVLECPEEECRKWFDKQEGRYRNDLGGMNALMEKQTGDLIGFAGLLVQTVDDRQELEVAYSLLAPYRRLGFATEAACKAKDFAFEHRFAESVISLISLTNVPSARVAVKNGMTVDRQTAYHGNPVNIYRIHRNAWVNVSKVGN